MSGPSILNQVTDLTSFVPSGGSSGAHNDVISLHSGNQSTTHLASGVEAFYAAPGDSKIEGEYTPAGFTFDNLADSNAQNILRKVGWLILLAQLVSLLTSMLGNRGGGFAQAYGGGGGWGVRLAATIAAVYMLTDIRVVPHIIDLLQEGVVAIGNWIFGAVDEASSSGTTTY